MQRSTGPPRWRVSSSVGERGAIIIIEILIVTSQSETQNTRELETHDPSYSLRGYYGMAYGGPAQCTRALCTFLERDALYSLLSTYARKL